MLIIIYIIVTIIKNIDELILPIIFVIITMDNNANIIPIITDINELVLCFTTSALFSASNFGYFKLTFIPMKWDTNGINNKDSNILILNFINRIIFPINSTGVVIIKQEYILDISIVFIFIGNDFKMFMFFPSKLITELVIDVIYAVKDINTNINIDILLFNNSFDNPRPPSLLVNIGII